MKGICHLKIESTFPSTNVWVLKQKILRNPLNTHSYSVAFGIEAARCLCCCWPWPSLGWSGHVAGELRPACLMELSWLHYLVQSYIIQMFKSCPNTLTFVFVLMYNYFTVLYTLPPKKWGQLCLHLLRELNETRVKWLVQCWADKFCTGHINQVCVLQSSPGGSQRMLTVLIDPPEHFFVKCYEVLRKLSKFLVQYGDCNGVFWVCFGLAFLVLFLRDDGPKAYQEEI